MINTPDSDPRLPATLTTNRMFEDGNEFCDAYGSKHHDLSVLHINARSIKHRDKFCEFLTFVESFNNELDIIIVSESWLSESDPLHMYNINGYSSEFWCRRGQVGGGLVVYISENLTYNRLTGLKIGNCEEGWIELKTRSSESILMGALYRPPNFSVKEFSDGIEKFGRDLENARVRCILVGDMNINLYTNNEYMNVLQSAGFTSLISQPTRSAAQSASNIDHVYVNAEMQDY